MKAQGRGLLIVLEEDQCDTGWAVVGPLRRIHEASFDDRDAVIRHHALELDANARREITVDLSGEVMAPTSQLAARPAHQEIR